MATLDPLQGADPSAGTMEVPGKSGSAPSPQSEAVTNELQELSLQPAPNLLPIQERKNVLQLKLQQRRTREELVSQGIMPPLKSPAAFHEQRRSLERARTEDYLKRKIRSRPERSELVRMHILEETSAEPSLQAKQLKLKRARLADDLNDKISHRPGPIELVHKNILSVSCPLQSSLLDSPKGAGGESSSLDEDSSDALSPDQLANHDSPLSAVTQLSPSHVLAQNGDMSPTQFLTQPPPPPPPPLVSLSDPPPLPKITNGLSLSSRLSSGHLKSQAKMSSDRPPQRSKKPKDHKPKVKKLKYHQYIPPDQKADKERPPQMDSSYAKLLQQQQLFLQLQILSQQQQHYNYHTILPAPPKPQADQPPSSSSGPSPSRTALTTTTTAPSAQTTAARQSQAAAAGAKPTTLPANLDEFKVAELKQELKLRGLTVSGTKNDLIERLRNYQEQNGNTAAALKNATPQLVQQASASAATTNTTASASNTTPTFDHQLADGACFKLALSSLAQAVPGRVMRFGSTSSSPPVSPTPSERSLAGLSPDETSCNGDMFGEMVTSPLTQLTLHPSPQHPSNMASLPQPYSVVKEEIQSSCSMSKSSSKDPPAAGAMETLSLDKDQMLQEKDKQIEELTRMLRQKQRLVETLRSQLEQGKMVAGAVVVKKEGSEKSRTPAEAKLQTLIKASSAQLPALPNGAALTVKEEVEPEKGMEGVTEEAQAKRLAQPMQCSQETLLRLQQIHRLQLQQAELQQQQAKLQKDSEGKANPHKQQQQQKKKEAQLLLHQQQLQHLIIQQTQQKQLQAQQKLAQQNQVKQTQGDVPAQQKNPVHKSQVQLKQVQVQIQNQKAAVSQRKQQRLQQRLQHKQQSAAASAQQVTPVIINQQNGTPLQTQAIALDLKANGVPTLVTDSNGNHYLIALSGHARDRQNGVSSLAKINGRITLQRLQSSPSKLPSTDSQSKQQPVAEPVSQPDKKGQKAALHLDTNGSPHPSLSHTAPPSLQPFFDDMPDTESQSNLMSSLKRKEEVCVPYDRHTLFTPPSPKQNASLPPQRSKENGVNNQQMDDLFDILLKSGEIPGFKANPDPSLAPLHSDPPSPSIPSSPLHLSPPTLTDPFSSQLRAGEPRSGGGRLEDFLESTTGAPLLGMEPDGGGLTLIDDLHSQMLSTPSILDHPPSPMDTSDLSFSHHSAGLDFGDPTLDSMDWLDISMGNGGGGGVENGGTRVGGAACDRDGGTSLTPLVPHTPPSVFSADFLDSTDLQLHWESCL
ncbi:myocardin related transcription factor Ab isoform X3 [Xiphophorus hellerii]|uniref:myocardin related transcription factor Ab isoform X3 n=1 Tax=Xiphophorus hellerii TaxID=8084 RepID=UPI0013B37612|nr:myocardin-related transcription factor B-like isoform X3 [Xiphophorus hellerii]